MGRMIGILLCFAFIGVLELPKLWRKKEKYQLWMFSGLFFISTLYCTLYVLEVPLPDPNGLIRMVFGGIGERLMQPAT